MKNTLKSLWDRWSVLFGRAEWIIVAGLLVILVACLFDICFGENPWPDEVRNLLDEGAKLGIRQRIAIGFRYGVITVAGCAFLLLISTPWWAVKRDMPPVSAFSKDRKVDARIFYPILVAAVLFGGWIRVPMMDHSFWNDEELAFRKFNWGEFREDKNGELKFRRVPWDYAFFYSISGNNHVAQTVVSKASHEFWLSALRKDDDPAFSEAATRFAPVCFGLFTILVLALALRSVGLGIAGLIAAWVLALHPWHIEYSTEARGYSGMLFFIVLSFWSLGKALRVPKWKWWMLFGIFQCLYLLHFAGAVYLAAATNIIICGILVVTKAHFGMRRWFVANVFSFMGFVIIMAPSLMAIFEYLTTHGAETGILGSGWFRDLWVHISTGMSVAGSDASLGWAVGERELASKNLFFSLFWGWVLPLGLLAVLIGAGLRFRFLFVFFGSLLLASALALGHSVWKNTILLEWYLLYLIIGVVVAFGLSGEFAYRVLVKRTSRIAAVAVTLLISLGAVLAYASTTLDQRTAIRFHDLQPIREAVVGVLGEAPPESDLKHEQLLTASVGPGADQFKSYDPSVICCKNLSDFQSAVTLAQSRSRPLKIYCNSPNELKRRDPLLFSELVDSGRFNEVSTHKGVEEFWSIRVYQLK